MRRGSAFTLIELVIVIAIIGILSSLAVPKLIDMSTESQIAATKGGLGTLRAVLATKYASSATAGGVASYPISLSSADFASGQPLHNQVQEAIQGFGAQCTAINAWAETAPWMYNVLAAYPGAFWYITDSLSPNYGKAGAYGDASINTSTW